METDHEQIKNLLTETLTLLLRSGVKFKQQLSIEGLLGVHIDKQDVFFVHISKTFEDEKFKKAQESAAAQAKKDLEIVEVEESKPKQKLERRDNTSGRRSRERPRINYSENDSVLDEYDDSPRIKRRRREPGTIKDNGERGKPFTVRVKQDPNSSNEVSLTSDYDHSDNSAERIKVEPSEYQVVEEEEEEEDADQSESGFGNSSAGNSAPHPIALFSTGNSDNVSNSPQTNIASSSSWPDDTYSESYEQVQILDDDDETISETSQPYVIQPDMNQWGGGANAQAGPSTSQGGFDSWQQSAADQDPQKVPETLILPGEVNLMEVNNNDLAKSCETIYVTLCNDWRSKQNPDSIQNKPVTIQNKSLAVHNRLRSILNESVAIRNKSVVEHQANTATQAEEMDSETCGVCKVRNGHRNVCPVCGKCCMRPSDLKRHYRTHTGERPFECEVCGQRFKCTGSMYGHQRNVHKMRIYRVAGSRKIVKSLK